MKLAKPIELDGRTGEGGGQLVRNAVALAAVTSQPVKITNVRGNRGGKNNKGGGLKSQHVTGIKYLQEATGADVDGLSIGSQTLVFRPKKGPSQLAERHISIRAESPAASGMLIFQSILPFLLFASNENHDPIAVDISGGTNVSFSMSFEYVDQVLLPTLENWFGIGHVERKLHTRGWSVGTASRGLVSFKIQPLKFGTTLSLNDGLELGQEPDHFDLTEIQATIVAPSAMHNDLRQHLTTHLEQHFADVKLVIRPMEDSNHNTRTYVLLVAKSNKLIWGRDILFAKRGKGQTTDVLARQISQEVSQALYDQVFETAGMVDQYLQDQLVIFQALAEGRTSFPRNNALEEKDDRGVNSSRNSNGNVDGLEDSLADLHIGGGPRLKKDKALEPFGESADTMHTKTARWVTTELLPEVSYYNKGRVCEGIATVAGKS